ncbi:hypothetical protein C8R43DRAFT_69089 [Mycena crocata]|nr:hypothetical protein C8R43DRAFT_69089 [Mycena crocata]
MATPSSSATSPSPTMAFAPSLQLAVATTDTPQPDHRQRAVEKFKARAEISNVTRSLRARLSYASYKATHNISHLPLRELEAQSQSQIQIYGRTLAAKRKAASTISTNTYATSGVNRDYYNNPATQGGASQAAAINAGRRPGAMAPPTGVGRSYYPGAVNGGAGGSALDGTRPPLATSLFSSILAPPPTQQARTILNVADPPVPPPSRPPASPRPRTSKTSARSIAEGTRAMAKTRADKPDSSKRKAKRSLEKGKQKQRRHSHNVDADGDVDMKAAATLTSLLLNHRPSMGSASSPRSSLDESETGSQQSYSQFAQSSARHAGGGSATPVPPPNVASTSASAGGSSMPEFRRASATPPPSQGQPGQQTTPRPAPTDNEAADLMLFLATSPSPVRKDSKDLAAYRALTGVRPKGRVLFPTAGSMADVDKHVLARGTDSFTSSVSSIGGEMRPTGAPVSRTSTPVPAPAATPPTIAAVPTAPTSLLPPPSLPQSEAPPNPTPRTESPKPVYGQQVQQPIPTTAAQPQPMHPGAQPQQQGDFNFSDFLHASPSPRPGSTPAQKQNLGLRADVGRKLFEEQLGHGLGVGHGHAQGKQRAELGAGIDLVQS